jgi:hypothetical protein
MLRTAFLLSLILLAAPAAADDAARAEIVATVHAVHPFLWSDGMERVTPVDLVLHEETGSRIIRVHCVGFAVSWRCRSRLGAMLPVVVSGELRPLLLYDPATDDLTSFPLAVAVDEISIRR